MASPARKYKVFMDGEGGRDGGRGRGLPRRSLSTRRRRAVGVLRGSQDGHVENGKEQRTGEQDGDKRRTVQEEQDLESAYRSHDGEKELRQCCSVGGHRKRKS